ncbi:MAG: DUF2079 domain-containing protein [Solirubrobacteraceae bacterium]
MPGSAIARPLRPPAERARLVADQAIWHYSRFESPFSSILGKNILGDHFSPLVAALTPHYWVWSDPRVLVIAQSLLVAASIVPVFLFARPRLGRAGGYLLAGAYAVFWGIQSSARISLTPSGRWCAPPGACSRSPSRRCRNPTRCSPCWRRSCF